LAEKEKIPVSIYQLNLSAFDNQDFPEIVADMIRKAAKEGYVFKEEKLRQARHGNYQIRIYSSFNRSPPKWKNFLAPMLHAGSRLHKSRNHVYSFICFVGYGDHIFAVTGGGGKFAIERYVLDDFGLAILVRLFDKESKVIKSIQDRGLTGVILGQSRFYRGDQRFSDEDQFGKIYKLVKAELNKTILTKIFGFPESQLKRDVSGCLAKSSFQINKALSFDMMLGLIQRLTEILKQEAKFALNKVEQISRRSRQNAALLENLQEKLISDLYTSCKNGEDPDVDFCHKNFEEYLTASYFTIPLDKEEPIEFDDPPGLPDIIRELRKRKAYFDEDVHFFYRSLLDRQLCTYTLDSDGQPSLSDDVLKHIHGEIVHEKNHYFRVDGEWYRILPEFIKSLDRECSGLLKDAWDDRLIAEIFDIKKREIRFNMQFVGKPGWLVFDTITPENIECCDILQHDETIVNLVHVKKGFDNSIRDLASQVIISAKRIRDDIRSGYNYITALEDQTKKGLKSPNADLKKMGGQKFPAGGLKQVFQDKNGRHKKIAFCLAFVDTALEKRSLKDDIRTFHSNIAKYSLIELRSDINSMGFEFKVIQLNK
jgi:uncharacterized protein (TIGR04141 family)